MKFTDAQLAPLTKTELIRIIRTLENENQILLSGKVRKPSVEYYTPPEWISRVKEVMEVIDLDPASNPMAQSWINAAKYFTKDDDGLSKQGEWAGKVFCNPPYGFPTTRNWCFALRDSYFFGGVGECIILLNRSNSEWYRSFKKSACSILECKRRISFIGEQGVALTSPRYDNDFVYFGQQPEKFNSVFGEFGYLV